jgi:hypothetical protein
MSRTNESREHTKPVSSAFVNCPTRCQARIYRSDPRLTFIRTCSRDSTANLYSPMLWLSPSLPQQESLVRDLLTTCKDHLALGLGSSYAHYSRSCYMPVVFQYLLGCQEQPRLDLALALAHHYSTGLPEGMAQGRQWDHLSAYLVPANSAKAQQSGTAPMVSAPRPRYSTPWDQRYLEGCPIRRRTCCTRHRARWDRFRRRSPLTQTRRKRAPFLEACCGSAERKRRRLSSGFWLNCVDASFAHQADRCKTHLSLAAAAKRLRG